MKPSLALDARIQLTSTKFGQQSLTDSDRDLLKSFSTTMSTYTAIGTIAGLLLAGYLARRIRQNRTIMYNAFRAKEKPTHVRFADGREEAVPDISELLKPTAAGDIATYTLFAAGGVLLGGEMGLLAGSWRAKSSITSNPESKARIEKAFRSFRADVLRKQAEALEKGSPTGGAAGELWL